MRWSGLVAAWAALCTAGVALAAPQPVTPIWLPDAPATPHPIISGAPTTLKGVNLGALASTFSWDFGDGEATEPAFVVGVSGLFEISRTYVGEPGDTFTATLTLCSALDDCAQAAYPMEIVADTPHNRARAAIGEGLWAQYRRFDRATGTHDVRSLAAEHAVAVTHALLSLGHDPGADPASDPYGAMAADGLRTLFDRLAAEATVLRPGGQPDTNGNGRALAFVSPVPLERYSTALAVQAIVATGTPDAVVATGVAAGDRYRTVVEDLLDGYALWQNDGSAGVAGWSYQTAPSMFADNSIGGWAATAALAARRWGIESAPYVWPSMLSTLSAFAEGQGPCIRFGYATACREGGCAPSTASGVQQLLAVGLEPGHPLFDGTLRGLATRWGAGVAEDDFYMVSGNVIGRYTAFKALDAAGLGPLVETPCPDAPGEATLDWYGDPERGLLAVALATQQADGGFVDLAGGSHSARSLIDPWSVVMLSPVLTGLVRAAGVARPGVMVPGGEITLDHSASYSLDPDRRLVRFDWDLDGDGQPELTTDDREAGLTFVATVPEGAPMPYTLMARLTVTDDADPPNTARVSVPIVIDEVNVPPVALLDGPALAGVGHPATFDGRRSYDPNTIPPVDDPISAYRWSTSDPGAQIVVREGGRLADIEFDSAGRHVVLLEVVDSDPFDTGARSNMAYASVDVVVNGPPTANAQPQGPIECTGPAGAEVVLDGSRSTDADADDVLSYAWSPPDDLDDPTAPVTRQTLPLGQYERTLTVTDLVGLTDEAVARFEVVDTQAPTLDCPAVAAACTGAMTPVATQVTVADVCGAGDEADYDPPAAYPLGQTRVEATYVDPGGQRVACEVVVDVADDVPPELQCSAGRAECAGEQTRIELTAEATDGCDPEPVVFIPDDRFFLGEWLVQFSAVDSSFNRAVCEATAVVVDTTPPALQCDPPVVAECAGARTFAAPPTARALDACAGPLQPGLVDPAGGSYVLGANPVEFSAVDNVGLVGRCASAVNIVDTTAPDVQCVDQTARCTGPLTPQPRFDSAFDVCQGALDSALDAPGPYAVGETAVRASATDGSGNTGTCDFTVTIYDDIVPTIECRDGEAECTGPETAVEVSAVVDDLCDPEAFVVRDGPEVFGPAGGQVFFTAFDASGNQSTCAAGARVVDTTPPVVQCEDVEVECTGRFTDAPQSATADDVCSGAADPFVDDDGPYRLGETAVTWTAFDDAANVGECRATVRVVDTTPPAIECVGGTVECADGTGPVALSATAEDTCAGAIEPVAAGLADFPGGRYPLGETTVEFVATDPQGNRAACDAVATVVDTTPPALICGDIEVECAGPATPVDHTAFALDGCAGALPAAPDVAGPFGVGETPITYSAVDPAGRRGTCDITVRVVDRTRPDIACRDAQAECTGALTPVDVGADASDVCAGDLDPVGDVPAGFPVGATRVPFEAIDPTGNRRGCEAVATVVDTTPPVIECPAEIVIDADADCRGRVDPQAVATDACDAAPSIGRIPADDVWPAGRTPVRFTAVDAAGHVVQCETAVVVIAPDLDDDGQCDAADADDDGDTVPDADDVDPRDPRRCRDADGDGCDDCALGLPDPRNDGPDADGDGRCDPGDDDRDGDTVPDADDVDPADPLRCRDADGDTCDDCAVRSAPAPADDGPDFDRDGLCDAGDDDDDNDGVPDDEDPEPRGAGSCGDVDGDGCDDCVNGDADPANDGPDLDGDGRCDAGDVDDDGDTVPDAADFAPRDPRRCRDVDLDGCDDCAVVDPPDPMNDGADLDGDGRCDAGDDDQDGDGVFSGADVDDRDPLRCRDEDRDTCDDCAIAGRPDQQNDGPDLDGDWLCDAGDDDDDDDGVDDFWDTDPRDPMRCADVDADGCDDCSRGLPADPADDGPDLDGDGWCDLGDDDSDADGVADEEDVAPLDPMACRDADGDGCDDCAINGRPAPADDGLDSDRDGLCDAGDPDDDDDTVLDGDDLDPLDRFVCRDADGDGCDDCNWGTPDPSRDGPDNDGDGLCDAGDPDDDDDTVLDGDDTHPYDVTRCADGDGDGCDDCAVVRPPDPAGDGADLDGDGLCDAGDVDADGDGVTRNAEPFDVDDRDPGRCGDTDGDGCDDCAANRRSTPADDGPDFDGDGLCDAGDPDDDSDGVEDGRDRAPLDPTVCADEDGDRCDDCSNGSYDRGNDGPDLDGDGACDAGDFDDDGDGVNDADDRDPRDRSVCADTDEDGCDDCAINGWATIADDGADLDEDGLCDLGDADDDNDGVDDEDDVDPRDAFACRDADDDTCDDCAVAGFAAPDDDGPDDDGDGVCNAGEGPVPQPDAAVPAPDAAVPEPDMALPGPDAAVLEPDAAAPEVDMAAPEVDMAAPEVDMAAPEVDMAAPEVDMAALAPDMAAPAPDMAAPEADMAAAELDMAPLPDAGGPTVGDDGCACSAGEQAPSPVLLGLLVLVLGRLRRRHAAGR